MMLKRHRAIAILSVALMAIPAFTAPPPTPNSPHFLPLNSSLCPMDVASTVAPYSPAVYHFNGTAQDTLLLINLNPDPSLNFTLGLVEEAPFITGAGFGADVRVRLPRTGVYQLEISSFDPVRMKANETDFGIRLALRGDVYPEGC